MKVKSQQHEMILRKHRVFIQALLWKLGNEVWKKKSDILLDKLLKLLSYSLKFLWYLQYQLGDQVFVIWIVMCKHEQLSFTFCTHCEHW